MAALDQPAPGADPDDQTTIVYRDDNFPFPLDRYKALHYFEMSPFFDRQSNNALARQQGRDPAILGALEFVAPAGGLEYVIDSEQPPSLFVIRKQMRKGPDTSIPGSVTALAYYYILDKTIYQAPSLHSVLTTRIRRCVFNLHKAFDRLQDDLDPLVQLTKLHDQQSSIETGADQPTSNNTAASTAALEGPDTDTQLGSQGSNAALLASATHRTAGGSASRVDHRPVAGAGPSDTPAMPLPQRVNEEEAAHWKRTDNIIMTVLSGYPLPTLPPVYHQQQGPLPVIQPPPPQDPNTQDPTDTAAQASIPTDNASAGPVAAAAAAPAAPPAATASQPAAPLSTSTAAVSDAAAPTGSGPSGAPQPSAAGGAAPAAPTGGGGGLKVKVKFGAAAAAAAASAAGSGAGGAAASQSGRPGDAAPAAKKSRR